MALAPWGGNKHALHLWDVATGFEYIMPTKTPGAGLVTACDEMGILRDPSHPYIHQHNAKIEKSNSTWLDGTRTALVQAG